MSKAFDSIDRHELLLYLSEIQMKVRHILHLLINDVVINVQVGNETGDNIKINVGSCHFLHILSG